MFERFSASSRRALVLARQEALDEGATLIRLRHLRHGLELATTVERDDPGDERLVAFGANVKRVLLRANETAASVIEPDDLLRIVAEIERETQQARE
jgi:hypothetical protein